MMQTKEKKESIEFVKSQFKKGDTIFTQLHNRTPNGTIYFSVRYIKDNRPYTLNYYVAKILGMKLDKKWNCLKQPFGNMDMGFHTIYTFSHKVFNDGYFINHDWL